MQFENKWIIPIRSTVFLSVVGAIIGFGVYGCKKEEPVREDTAPTESVEEAPSREYTPPIESDKQEPPKKDTLTKEPVSLKGNLENTKIAFMSNRNGNLEIYVMNADGSEQKRLTNNPASGMDPSWSPDGKKIAFVSYRDGNPEIYVMNADGSEQRNLTNNWKEDNFWNNKRWRG
jgi:dipeptidyl aminopeptidase/acylaminoacyl peptidase